jgi:hypothetical protein
LAEPGGYLQWIELEGQPMPDLPEYPVLFEADTKLNAFWKSCGFSHHPHTFLSEHKVPPSLESTLKLYPYPWNVRPELVEDATIFISRCFESIIPVILYRTGETDSLEAGADRTREVTEAIQVVPKEKLVSIGKWSAMVAKKQYV